MKLRTSLQISAVFPVALAIIVALGMIIRSTEISAARSGLETAQTILELVSVLDAQTYRVMLSTDKTAFDRWQTESGKLEKHLAGKNFSGVEGFFLNEVKEAHADLKTSVAGIKTIWEDVSAGKAQSGAEAEVSRLQKKVANDLGRMQSNAIKMVSRANAGAGAREQFVDTLFVVFIGVFAMLMAASTLATSSKAVRQFEKLRKACDAAAEGNFTHRLEVPQKDEIGEVFRSFNRMTSAIGERITKLDNELGVIKMLEKERDTTSAAAREGNMRLADALTRLKRAQGQLIEQERLRALEQIAAGVARDFNTALAPILTTSDYLLTTPESLGWRNELVENIQVINTSVKKALKQTRTLSDLFQDFQQPEASRVNVGNIIDRALEHVKQRLSLRPVTKHVAVDRRQAAVSDVVGNDVDFIEAVAAVIDNAYEAMPEGGRLTIETAMDGDVVVVRITDTGEGMAEDIRQRCLEPFFSTKGPQHSGMGLTFAVAAAGRYGGTISVNSEQGKGSCVTLRFAAYDDRKHYAAPPVEGGQVRKKLKILVIDDEQWIRALFTKILIADGHTIQSAQNGTEGINIGTAGGFDAVILDRALPDINGDQVAAKLRAKLPRLPIIMVSGMGEMMKEKGEKPAGVDIVLSKPLTIAELRAAITKVMQGS